MWIIEFATQGSLPSYAPSLAYEHQQQSEPNEGATYIKTLKSFM